jgi:S-adenosylmethionine:tRNA ribosyltransferase-isomerase
MRTDEFDYVLPKELIAQHPEAVRPSSRLLVLKRSENRTEHRHFKDITEYLMEGDLLVVNDTKVIPARIEAVKKTGGTVEILLVERIDDRRWRCLVNGVKRGADSTTEVYAHDTALVLTPGLPFWTVEFPEEKDAHTLMAECGRMPLPHYIKRSRGAEGPEDHERYQTVYATHVGSIAAPTAGLHFDKELLERIGEMGVGFAKVTLNIGVGTFFLIKSEDLEDHIMHGEQYSIPVETAHAVRETKAKGGRVIGVGTSAVRTLESAALDTNGASLSGSSDLFIYPGYRFKVIDALITNFHLPRSTPLMLVSAFAGKERIAAAYREAIERGYRFYSYGDSMFIS